MSVDISPAGAYLWRSADHVKLPDVKGRGLEGLTERYDGPIMVVDSAALHNAHGPMVGSQNLMGSVSALDVPIVYRGEDPVLSVFPHGSVVSGASRLQSLQASYPHARLYLVGTTAGSDASEAVAAGAEAFLINTDPTQREIPTGFNGTITDDFTAAMQQRVMASLQHYPSVSVSNVPAAPPVTLGDKLALVDREVVAPLAGLPGEIERFFEARRADASEPAEAVLAASRSDLAGRSPAQLSALADSIMAGQDWDETERSHALLRILDSAGDDPGQRDAMVSRLTRPQDLAGMLVDGDRAAWQAELERSRPVRGDWDGFEHYVDGLTGTRRVDGSRMEPLIDGTVVFDERLKAMAQARKYINVGTFIFNSDATGRAFADALMEAAARGVKVRVFYDALGSGKTYGQPTDMTLFDTMRQHGIEIVEHEPGPFGDHLTHRKILAMDSGDGQVAFTGGMNVGNEYSVRWHDVDCKVTGPAAADLNRLFIDGYREDGGTIPAADEQVMMAPGPAVAGGGPTRVVGHTANRDEDLKLVYLRAIDTAQHSIQIANPYVSDPDIIEHLMAAAQHGVKVELFLPHTVDDELLQRIARSHYQPMAAAGIQLYEYDGKPMAHEKVATFDDRVSTVGSSNFDARSLHNNDEDNVWSSQPEVAADINQKLFDRDRLSSIDYDHYEPGIGDYLIDKAAALTAPWA